MAAHQTLCPACRSPVPSEAGPVAASAEGSAFTFSAPPPRQAPRPPTTVPPTTVPPTTVPSEPEPERDRGPNPDAEATDVVAAVEPEPTALVEPDEPTAVVGSAPAETAEGGTDAAPVPVPAPAAEAEATAVVDATGTAPATAGPAPSAPAPPAWAPDPAAAQTWAHAGPPAGHLPSGHQPSGPWSFGAPEPTATLPASTGSVSAGTLGVPGAAALDERGNLPGGLLGLVAAALVVVGVFLPWVEVGGETVSGWSASADAKVLLGVAGVATVAAALLIGGARSLVLRLLLVVLGVAAVGLGGFEVTSVNGVEGLEPSVGTGIYVGIGGGVVLALAGGLTRHRRFR